MKSRKMIIAVLLFAAVAVSSATFAYWASSVSNTNDTATGTVTIGEGNTVTTSVNVNDQSDAGQLVPTTITGGTSDVDLTFPVLWESDDTEGANAFTGVLTVSVNSIEVGQADKSNLFTVTVTDGSGNLIGDDTADGIEITEDIAQDVVVNVEFTNEPADQTEYNDVASNDVIVSLTYSIIAD